MANNVYKIDRSARWSYEKLLLSQPHIQVEGLYLSNNYFKILIPNFETLKSEDGQSLEQWFKNQKAMVSPIKIVGAIGPEDIPIQPRTSLEIAALTGDPLNLGQVIDELNILLGVKFPRYILKTHPPFQGTIVVERELEATERNKLDSSLNSLGLPFDWIIEVGSMPVLKEPNIPDDPMVLMTPRNPKLSHLSQRLRDLVDKDDEFWITSGRKLLASGNPESSDYSEFKKSFYRKDSSLINATAFPPNDIRNHLTLFENTNIVLPLDHFTDQALFGLGLTEDELIDLLVMGRIRIIMSTSTHRYSAPLLEKLIEARPDGVVFPRMLTAALVENTREKFPYLFPIGEVEQRAEYLRALLELQKRVPIELPCKPIDALVNFHKNNWTTFELALNLRGPLFMLTHGAGIYLSEIFSTFSGNDHSLEFGSADLSVNMASMMGATYFPVEGEGWSDRGHSAILAKAYTGGIGTFVSDFHNRLDIVLDGMLSIRKDIPVTDLARSIGSGDIPRLKKHVFEIAYSKNISLDDLKISIDKLNKEVRAIESKQDRLAKWDLLDIASGAVTYSLTKHPILGLFAGILTKRFLREIPELRSKHPLAGASLDSLESLWHKTSPDRVLFARVRKQLTSK